MPPTIDTEQTLPLLILMSQRLFNGIFLTTYKRIY